MPADPVVSPADTIRRDPIDEAADFVAAALVGLEWEVRDSDGEPPTWVERGVGDECVRFIETPLSYAESCRIENLLNVARALLAVGERDGAEIALYDEALASLERIMFGDAGGRSRDELDERAEQLVEAGERDRRQIARLTEIAREVAETPCRYLPRGACGGSCLYCRARAVLADKEDAG